MVPVTEISLAEFQCCKAAVLPAAAAVCADAGRIEPIISTIAQAPSTQAICFLSFTLIS
jgi:hypothetical protein